MSRLILRGGRVIDPASRLDELRDVLVEEGHIAAVAKPSELPASAEEGAQVVDVVGRWIVPGLVDLHTHLREPGFEYKETIRTGTAAAAAGGFTTVACMANTDPPNDNAAVTDYILKKARTEGLVNVLPIGAVTRGLGGEDLAEMGELRAAGVVALSDDGNPIMNAEVMRRALEYAKGFGLTIIVHAEDSHLAGRAVMNEGQMSTRLGLSGSPPAAEEVMIARDILLAELAGAQVHFAHVSTAGGVELIRWAKERGLAVTAEVSPHHLTLTDEALGSYDPNAKVNPPLRTARDIEALRQGLREGVFEAIATDHAPHDVDAKEVELNAAACGISGLETALPLVLKVVEEGGLDLVEAIARLTVGPARILGIDKGSLAPGREADITVIDPADEFEVDPSEFRSKGKNTPFAGWKLRGRAVSTLVAGSTVFERSGSKRK